jgi:hypothetical protein
MNRVSAQSVSGLDDKKRRNLSGTSEALGEFAKNLGATLPTRFVRNSGAERTGFVR